MSLIGISLIELLEIGHRILEMKRKNIEMIAIAVDNDTIEEITNANKIFNKLLLNVLREFKNKF